MEINQAQRKSLENIQSLRRSQATVWGQIRRHLWIYIIRLIGVIILIPLAVLLDSGILLLLTGVVLGATFRDLQNSFIWRKIWPVLAAVLDWERIDELLASS